MRDPIQRWQTIASQQSGDFRIFRIRSDLKKSPVTGQHHDFYVIDCTNWVNVVAITSDNQLIMVEQYRHGSDTVELEIPGGMMDAHDESPSAAGLRELKEETGYYGAESEIIGEVFPNPAIMSNRCYTLLVRNCSVQFATCFDDSEDLVTRLVPVDQVPDLIYAGKIRHALVVAALCQYDLWKRKQ